MGLMACSRCSHVHDGHYPCPEGMRREQPPPALMYAVIVLCVLGCMTVTVLIVAGGYHAGRFMGWWM